MNKSQKNSDFQHGYPDWHQNDASPQHWLLGSESGSESASKWNVGRQIDAHPQHWQLYCFFLLETSIKVLYISNQLRYWTAYP
jgi:hypothetical protein